MYLSLYIYIYMYIYVAGARRIGRQPPTGWQSWRVDRGQPGVGTAQLRPTARSVHP